MEPAATFGREDALPIDIADSELGDGSVATIGTSRGGAHTKTAFGEIEAVANGSSDAVILFPDEMALIDAALVHEVFDEATDGVVGQGGNDSRSQAETSLQAAGNVVFSAALEHAKLAGGGDSEVTWIEA